MKRYFKRIALAAACVFCAASMPAQGATNQEITFRGVPWGLSPEEYVVQLDQVLFDGARNSIEDPALASVYEDYTAYLHEPGLKNNIGAAAKGYMISYKTAGEDVTICGYPIDRMELSAFYDLLPQGTVSKSLRTAKVYAVSAIITGDFGYDPAFDVQNTEGCGPFRVRLTDKYGKPTEQYSDSALGSAHSNYHALVWYGANGTYVRLRHVYDSYVLIEYGTLDALAYIEAAERGAPIARKFSEDDF